MDVTFNPFIMAFANCVIVCRGAGSGLVAFITGIGAGNSGGITGATTGLLFGAVLSLTFSATCLPLRHITVRLCRKKIMFAVQEAKNLLI